jgi:hypothetical protein
MKPRVVKNDATAKDAGASFVRNKLTMMIIQKDISRTAPNHPCTKSVLIVVIMLVRLAAPFTTSGYGVGVMNLSSLKRL